MHRAGPSIPNVLMSSSSAKTDLDNDIDDYEDSRVELKAIGHNLVIFGFSALLNFDSFLKFDFVIIDISAYESPRNYNR